MEPAAEILPGSGCVTHFDRNNSMQQTGRINPQIAFLRSGNQGWDKGGAKRF